MRNTVQVNFTNLKAHYDLALEMLDDLVIFTVDFVEAHLLFIIDLADEDDPYLEGEPLHIPVTKGSDDIYLRVSGDHERGEFLISFDDTEQTKILRELGLLEREEKIDFRACMEEVNRRIPRISYKEKVKIIRDNRGTLKDYGILHEAEGMCLAGIDEDYCGRPDATTVRKLYACTNFDDDDIGVLVSELERCGRTVKWVRPEDVDCPVDIQSLIQELREMEPVASDVDIDTAMIAQEDANKDLMSKYEYYDDEESVDCGDCDW